MAKGPRATKVRLNVTLDAEMVAYLDELVAAGHVRRGRRVYRTRSAAIEHMVDEWLTGRLEGAGAVGDYLLAR